MTIFENIVYNENTFTELFRNLMRFKVFRREFLNLINCDFSKEVIDFDCFSTQKNTNNGRPDLVISTQTLEIFIEIKVWNTTLTENQPEGYLKELEGVDKDKKLLILLAPRSYKYFKIYDERKKTTDTKIGTQTIFWTDIIDRIDQEEIFGGFDSMTVDYTQDLISEAKVYRKANKLNYSRMFYATFFEHQINELIFLYCLRNNIDIKTQTAIIQSVNIWGKFTWLLQLLNYPNFNKKHLNTIKNLADSRNSFVHYKWKEDPDFHRTIDSRKEQEKIDVEFDKIEKAVIYFKSYCSKIQFNGKKEQIKKLLK